MTFHAARPVFWRQVRGLSDAAKLVGAYLLNCDSRRPGGLLHLRADYVGADLEWPADRVTTALSELNGAGMIVHDAEAELVYFTTWRVHDPLPGCGLAVSVARELLAIWRSAPGSPAVVAAMCALREEASRLLAVAKESDSAAPKLKILLSEMTTLPGTEPPSVPGTVPPSLPPSVGGTAGEKRRGAERSGGSTVFSPLNAEMVAPGGAPRARASGPRKQRDASVPAEATRLAQLLADLIHSRDAKARVDPGRWAPEIEKLSRLDGRDWSEIERIIRFAQADRFWKGNILSGAKLRKQFDALVAQADRDRGDQRPAESRPARPVIDASADRLRHEDEMAAAAKGGAQ